MPPKVSVIIPTYNNEKYIKAAVDSASRQTYRDLEVIVLNDGSTDSTLDIVSQAALTDPRIRVITRPHSGKPSIARNAGIRIAQGEYICFLDGDDLFYPEKVRDCVYIFEGNPSIQFVFHDMRYMYETGREERESHLQRAGSARANLVLEPTLGDGVFSCDSNRLAYWMCLISVPFHMSSVMVRRKLLDGQKVWFPEDMLIGEDFELWFRLVKSGSVAFLDKVLSARRMHKESITRRPDTAIWTATARIRNYNRSTDFFSSSQRKAFRKRISDDLFNCGYAQSRQGDTGDAQALYIESLRWDPNIWSIKRAVLGILKAHLRSALGNGIRRST